MTPIFQVTGIIRGTHHRFSLKTPCHISFYDDVLYLRKEDAEARLALLCAAHPKAVLAVHEVKDGESIAPDTIVRFEAIQPPDYRKEVWL